jgi:ketosteroid isomerase-like protein
METTSPHDVSSFLDRYADALAAGDLPGIAACYALPALVVGDAATIPVAEPGQVEAAFAGVADAYRAQGMVGLRPQVQAVDPLTGTLTLVDVRWDYLDQAGAVRQQTSYRYLLRRTDGRLGIQVVVDTTPAQPRAPAGP